MAHTGLRDSAEVEMFVMMQSPRGKTERPHETFVLDFERICVG